MNIRLGKNLSENNVVNKNINWITTLECVVKGDISVEHPSVIVTYNDSLIGVNYAEIEIYNRKYYCSVKPLTGGRVQIDCICDVLYSFADDIRNLIAVVDKQSSGTVANEYVNDGSLIVQTNEFTRIHNFPNGFNEEGEFILICAGG